MIPAAHSDPRWWSVRKMPVWLRLVLLYAVAHIVWLLLAFPRTRFVKLYDVLILDSYYAVVAWRFFRAAARADLPARVRQALRFLAAGFAVGCVATTYLLIEKTLRPAPPSIFNLSDAFFLATYPLILTGLLLLPRGERAAAGPWRILLDGVVFCVGIGVPLWLFVIQPDLHRVTGVDAVLVVVWPAVAFCGVLAVNAALLTKVPVPSRPALWLLLAGIGLLWSSDLIFTLDAAAGMIARSPVNWINLANALALAVCLLAAWHYETDPLPVQTPERPAPFSPVPLLTIVLVSGWLALSALLQPGALALDRMLPSLTLLFVVLFVRETLVMRDSLRWAAAEAQREGQVRFEALVRNSSDIIMIVDPRRRIRFTSPAATVVLGRNPEELREHSLDEFGHPEEDAHRRQFFSRLLAEPAAPAFADLRLLHGDGSHRHFEITGTNLLREPAIGGLVLNLRDVSERVALEEHLHHAGKMEAVGRLAGGVAHDFNNLLAVIMANGDLTAFELPPEHPAHRTLEEIRRAAKRGAALTGRLLSFGHRGNATPGPVSPAAVLRTLTPVLQTLCGPGLTLHIRIDPGAGLVRVDPNGLEQALLNFAANARDATPGGGTLTLSVEKAVLRETLATPYLAVPPGRYVVIRAADTGSGMDEATRARLFEPFFTTKARGKGTGLGLASSYGMVKEAGGGLSVDTQPGRGTTFNLWLPELDEVAAAPAAPVPAEEALRGTETILIVEDEEPVRLATERILMLRGYTVLSASDADEARRVLQAHAGPLHLLLTDVIMPGQSGPQLAAELVKLRPDLRVLFMSGYTGQELGSHGLGRSQTNLLQKPFSVDELTVRVRSVLAGPAGLN
ncbi:MAG: ATP-binding protein [Opitutales bacterium]